jgi:hypothetical protein
MTNCSHVFTLNLFTEYNLVVQYWCFTLQIAKYSTRTCRIANYANYIQGDLEKTALHFMATWWSRFVWQRYRFVLQEGPGHLLSELMGFHLFFFGHFN